MHPIKNKVTTFFENYIIRLLAVTLLSAILIISLTGAIVTDYVVFIKDGQSTRLVYTLKDKHEDILKQEGVLLGPFDEFEVTQKEANIIEININRAKEVIVNVDNVSYNIYVVGGTVGDALKSKGIIVNDNDLINVSLQEQVNQDMQINISRVSNVLKKIEETIPFDIEEVPTKVLANGKKKSLIAGSQGKKVKTYSQKIVNGVILDEELISDEVTVKPVNAKVLVGNSKATYYNDKIGDIQLDSSGNPINYKYKVTGKATAYSSRGRPTKMKPGAVAMDLSKFPKGTKLYIKTPDGNYIHGLSEVKDTGTAVSDGRVLVDLFFETYQESVLFGAKKVDVYVL